MFTYLYTRLRTYMSGNIHVPSIKPLMHILLLHMLKINKEEKNDL